MIGRPALVAVFVGCAGCSDPSSTVDRHVEGLVTQELAVRVVLSDVAGSYPGIVVRATVMSRTAAWASLRAVELGADGGPARRFSDGIAELETNFRDLPPEECRDGMCELTYRVVLDGPPVEPWDVVLSVTIEGHPSGTASASIVVE